MQQDGVRSNQVTQVRGYADQMLRVKSNPFDPSNRRISILIKNDSETVPTLLAANVVNGLTPLPGAEKTSATAKKGAKAQGAQPATKTAAVAATPVASSAAKPPAPSTASPAKPAATAPAAKPSLMSKFKDMLPGGKK
jgi:chemotaxis protein MotB